MPIVLKNVAKFIALSALSLGLSISPAAYAGGGGTVMGNGGATEITQVLNNIELTMSYIEQAQQTVTQINQYMTMLQNLQRFGPSALLNAAASKLWTDANMNSSFKDLFSVVQGGTKLAYSMSSLSNQIKSMQPPSFDAKMNLNFDYAGAYRSWVQNSRNATDGALKVAGAQFDNLKTEQDMLSKLQEQAATAEGQMQALKAGADIGVAQVNQLQMLRQLMLAQSQSINMSQKATEARYNDAEDVLWKMSTKARPTSSSKAPSSK